jgi:hypothetical protein
MPDSVIKCVEAIALQDKRSGNMIFCDRNFQAIPDNNAEHDDGHENDIIAIVDEDANDDSAHPTVQPK